MTTWAYVENIVTIAAMVVIILGALYLGAGGYSWLGLMLLWNINYGTRRGTRADP